MTKISELTAGAVTGTVTGTLATMPEPRDITTKFGKAQKVCDATLKDASGECRLSIWGAEIAKYHQGDKVSVENGYVSVYDGKTQLSCGKVGKMQKL